MLLYLTSDGLGPPNIISTLRRKISQQGGWLIWKSTCTVSGVAVGSFMAGGAQQKSRESASTTKFYAKSDL